MKVNKDNFNIVLCSTKSDDNSFLDIFDTIYLEKNSQARFRISIIYSLFLVEDIDSMRLKVNIKYVGNGNETQMLVAKILDENLDFSEGKSDNGSLVLQKSNSTDVELPEEIVRCISGNININYTTQPPKSGRYQIEVFYKKEKEQEFLLGAVAPLMIHKK